MKIMRRLGICFPPTRFQKDATFAEWNSKTVVKKNPQFFCYIIISWGEAEVINIIRKF